MLSNQTVTSVLITGITTLLVTFNAMLMTYYIKIVRVGAVSKRVSAASLGGLVAGLFGIGCASCGSILMTALFTGVGSTALLFLPFDGAEVGLLGIMLLIYATKKLVVEIEKGVVCDIR